MDDETNRLMKAFNEIERFMREFCIAKGLGNPKKPPTRFTEFLNLISGHHPLLSENASRLRTYAALRNALVHSYNDEHHQLAIPCPQAVMELGELRDRLLSPPLLCNHFKKSVYTCDVTDNVGTVLSNMIEQDFSQVPVYREGQFAGLLNTETISRWIAKQISGAILGHEETVGNVLTHAHVAKKHAIVNEQATVFDALEAFNMGYESGCSLDAIVMTIKGGTTETPTGILTTFDIPALRTHVALTNVVTRFSSTESVIPVSASLEVSQR